MSHSILIAGAGISGLFASIALARAGYTVKLLEQDTAPPQADANEAFDIWQRRGVGQFRHSHAFLARLVNLIQEHYPDLYQSFLDAGARSLMFKDSLSTSLRKKYTPESGDEQLTLLSCRRTTLELVLREYVEQLPNVDVQHCTAVKGLVTRGGDDGLTVCGLQVEQDGQVDAEIRADVVVDATGRLSLFPSWFKALGVQIPEEKNDAEILYYTRHYRLREGMSEPERGDIPANGDLGYIKYGVFPADNGRFSVTICIPQQETELRRALREGEQFDKICNTFPGLKPWLEPERAEPVDNVYVMGDIRSRYRHYIKDEKPLALNFFAIGDALIRTNPLYGRGCSLGMVQAHLLAEVLSETDDPTQRAVLFDQRVETEVRPHYLDSVTNDKNAIKQAARTRVKTDKKPGLKARLAASFGKAIQAAARDDLEIARTFSRAFNLLDKPIALRNRRLLMKALWYWGRGEKRNQHLLHKPGPKRDEMYAILGISIDQQVEP
ncbi:MAG: NAD(P)/FAD-dependent oxidoreductase [Pseudomonadota bacterium]